jgi:hypothetical protein
MGCSELITSQFIAKFCHKKKKIQDEMHLNLIAW